MTPTHLRRLESLDHLVGKIGYGAIAANIALAPVTFMWPAWQPLLAVAFGLMVGAAVARVLIMIELSCR